MAEFGRIWQNLAEFSRIWQNLGFDVYEDKEKKEKEKKEQKEKFPMCESIGRQSLWGCGPKGLRPKKADFWLGF